MFDKIASEIYDNIGRKIKKLAIATFIVGAIAAVIEGLAQINTDDVVGILTLFLGPVAAWVSSWLLYGFGELIETNCEIAENTRQNKSNSKQAFSNTTAKKEKSKKIEAVDVDGEDTHFWIGKCQMCGRENVMIRSAKIVDNLGTRYRDICVDCFEKYNAEQE